MLSPWVDYTIALFAAVETFDKTGALPPPPRRPSGRKIGEPRGPIRPPTPDELAADWLGDLFGFRWPNP